MPTTNADTINTDLLEWLKMEGTTSYNSSRAEKGALANV
jgi:hypothetical protein